MNFSNTLNNEKSNHTILNGLKWYVVILTMAKTDITSDDPCSYNRTLRNKLQKVNIDVRLQ